MIRPTRIGTVRHILGGTVTVELDKQLAGVAPIWEGRLQPVGQIGSVVRIPQGPMTLLGTVTMLGISELSGAPQPSIETNVGDRWIRIQLVGELDGIGNFHRGVSTYPALDDGVHFATRDDLAKVFRGSDEDHVRLGIVASTADVPLSLEASKFVTRHAAVVGSTGSGKTSSVCSLLQSFVRGGWSSANIVVIDPHGEYSSALQSSASVRSVLGETSNTRLTVPYWTLPANDLLRALTGSSESATTQLRFGELVRDKKRVYASKAKWLAGLDQTTITGDTPIPFDLRDVWYDLEYYNRITFDKNQGQGDPQLRSKGDAEKLVPPEFDPPALGNAAPFKGPTFGIYGAAPEKMRIRMADRRLRFFFDFRSLSAQDDPLDAALHTWLGSDKPISVMDFSGVPGDVADLAIGSVLQNIFELAIRSRESGIGRPSPVLIVLEEAHRYLGDDDQVALARNIADRIAREGRKYGIGLLLISQRPSELPPTALSQVGTIIALRLTNGTDQSTVKASLPDSVAGLADALPSLRSGEAIVSGESVPLPTRVIIDRPEPWPDAADPAITAWRQAPPKKLQLENALKSWRGFIEE